MNISARHHKTFCPLSRAGKVTGAARRTLLAAALVFICESATATQIRIGPLTNSINGGAATNDVIVYAVGSTANADGSFSLQGLPKRLHLALDGSTTNFFMPGNYCMTNRDIGMAVGFGGFPDDASSAVYSASDWLIPGKFGALNFFVTRNVIVNTNAGGGSGTITNAVPTNAPGVSVAGPVIIVSTNYEAPGAAATALSNAMDFSRTNLIPGTIVTDSVANATSAVTATNAPDGNKIASLDQLTNVVVKVVGPPPINYLLTGTNNIVVKSNGTTIVNGVTNVFAVVDTTNVPTTNGTAPQTFAGPIAAPNIITHYTNIAQMISAPLSQGLYCDVDSYYGGTNRYGARDGGGYFYWSQSANGPTNYGTIFASANGGYWVRSIPESTKLNMAWWGVHDSMGSGDFVPHDDTARVQDCINYARKTGISISVPTFIIGITGLDLITKGYLTLEGENDSFDVKDYDDGPAFYYCGTSNIDTFVRFYNCDSCVVKGINFWSAAPYASKSSIGPTVLMDIDKLTNYAGNCTYDFVENCGFFNILVTNKPNFRAISISATSQENVEFIHLEHVTITGGGDNVFSNKGTGIYLGQSPNALHEVFNDIHFGNVATMVWNDGGSYRLDNFSGELPSLCFHIGVSRVGPILIMHGRVETPAQVAVIENNVPPVIFIADVFQGGTINGLPWMYLDNHLYPGSESESQIITLGCLFDTGGNNQVVFTNDVSATNSGFSLIDSGTSYPNGTQSGIGGAFRSGYFQSHIYNPQHDNTFQDYGNFWVNYFSMPFASFDQNLSTNFVVMSLKNNSSLVVRPAIGGGITLGTNGDSIISGNGTFTNGFTSVNGGITNGADSSHPIVSAAFAFPGQAPITSWPSGGSGTFSDTSITNEADVNNLIVSNNMTVKGPVTFSNMAISGPILGLTNYFVFGVTNDTSSAVVWEPLYTNGNGTVFVILATNNLPVGSGGGGAFYPDEYVCHNDSGNGFSLHGLVVFDTLDWTNGSSITAITNTGIFTLAAGHSYECELMPATYSGSGAWEVSFTNITARIVYNSSQGSCASPDNTTTESYKPSTYYITVSGSPIQAGFVVTSSSGTPNLYGTRARITVKK